MITVALSITWDGKSTSDAGFSVRTLEISENVTGKRWPDDWGNFADDLFAHPKPHFRSPNDSDALNVFASGQL